MIKLNSVIYGDCLVKMKKIEDKSIDMILCDLPYEKTACKWDIIIPFEPLWKQYKRIIKNNGAIVLTSSQPFTSLLVISNIKMFKYEWIWEKHKGTGHFNAKRQPLSNHENILIFCKKSTIYNPQKTEGKKYKLRGSHNKSLNKIVYNGGKSFSIGYSKNYDSSKRYPLTIQKFKNHNQGEQRLYPTQKPVELFKYLIKTYTNKKDLVLDNCAGSGTTAIACLSLKRNYILIEKEKECIDIIKKRIKEYRKKS